MEVRSVKKQLNQNLEQWCSMQMIVDYLNISRETVLQWIEKKNMPAHKVGRQWRFKISEVDEWIRSGEAAEKNEQQEEGHD
jgi:excisionase family DNA binding protein